MKNKKYEKDEIFISVNKILNQLLNYDEEHEFDMKTRLLGNEQIDSLLVVKLLTWCEEFFEINLITEDWFLDYLATLENLVMKIYELSHDGEENESI